VSERSIEGVRREVEGDDTTEESIVNDDSTSPATPSTDSTYEVLVDDNYHYMDEKERYSAGVFPTYGEALAHAKQIVDESLREFLEPGNSAGDLIRSYVLFGVDPWIRPTPEGIERFSARDYARQRATEIASPDP
jgi:hypothetical protein